MDRRIILFKDLIIVARLKQVLFTMTVPIIGYLYYYKGGEFPLFSFLLLCVSIFFLIAHIHVFNSFGNFYTTRFETSRKIILASNRITRMGLLTYSHLLLFFAITFGLLLGSKFVLLELIIVFMWMIHSVPPVYTKGNYLLAMIISLTSGILYFCLGGLVHDILQTDGLLFGSFFGIIFIGEQMALDVLNYESDKEVGIKSLAVLIGQRNTFLISLFIFLIAFFFGGIMGIKETVSPLESFVLAYGNLLLSLSLVT